MMSQFIEFDPTKQPRCKVELHVHLDGALRPTTIWELAKKKGIPLKARTLEDLIDSFCVKCPSTLAHFLEPFSVFIPIIAGDPEALERAAYEFCEDSVKQGVFYSEVRYCPHLFCTSHSAVKGVVTLTPRQVVMCVTKGLSRGAADFNLTVRSILCCFRPNPEWSEEILELCIEFRNQGVVGIDVAGDEAKGLAAPPIVAAFKRAATVGVHRTAHAGEAGPAKNVEIALTDLLAERIGHGYHVVDDQEIYAECLQRGVPFEVCPYSSLMTGSVSMASVKHPIVRFAEDNANFSISRDDPIIIQKTLDEEYEFLRGYGFKDVHFVRANLNAARSCFLPLDEKELLIQKLTEIYGCYTTLPSYKRNLEYIPAKAMSGAGDF